MLPLLTWKEQFDLQVYHLKPETDFEKRSHWKIAGQLTQSRIHLLKVQQKG